MKKQAKLGNPPESPLKKYVKLFEKNSYFIPVKKMEERAKRVYWKKKAEKKKIMIDTPPPGLSPRGESQWSRLSTIGKLILKRRRVKSEIKETKSKKVKRRKKKTILKHLEKENSHLKQAIRNLKQQEILKTIQQRKNDIMRHIKNGKLFDPSVQNISTSILQVKDRMLTEEAPEEKKIILKKPKSFLFSLSSNRNVDLNQNTSTDNKILERVEKRTKKLKAQKKLNDLNSIKIMLGEKTSEMTEGMTEFGKKVKKINPAVKKVVYSLLTR